MPIQHPDDYRDLYQEAPVGYVSLTPDGRVSLVNQRVLDWTGYTQEELIGTRLQEILSVAGRVFYETNIGPLLRLQGSVDEVAMDLVAKNRSRISCLVNASERRDLEGNMLSTRLAFFRATERRRYERALVSTNEATEAAAAAEREISDLREQFIAVLGHDLRNPLASIAGGIEMLGRRETLTDRGKHILGLMEGSIIRASALIDDVLDFARGRLGGGITLNRSADEPLLPVLQQVISEIRSISPERDIVGDFAIDGPIDCDRGRIGQLLSNLLGNAVTHGAPDIPIVVQAAKIEKEFILSVTNGGPPISDAAMARLFHPFVRGEVRSNQEGLGLGLHIASEIAKAHGGELTVTSTLKETRFVFRMPLAE